MANRAKIRRAQHCFICERGAELQIHHLDGDHSNDAPGNHVTLCQHCHSNVHKSHPTAIPQA